MSLTLDKLDPFASLEPPRAHQEKRDGAKGDFDLGVMWLNKGKYLKALASFDQYLGCYGDTVDAWYNKGLALAGLGRYEESEWAFLRALSLSGDYGAAWHNLGVVRCTMGRAPEADEPFERAFQLRDSLSNGGAGTLRIWATALLARGMDALLSKEYKNFEAAGEKYIDLLDKAEADGLGEVLEEAKVDFRSQLKKKKELKAFDDFHLYVDLMKIKDPFEGMRAIGRELSKRWPKGQSVVRAVREIRR